MGKGPGDRILIAQSMLGTPYKQETTKALRTGTDKAALQNMDCSEYVSRVLAGDKVTDGVQWKTSGQLVNMFNDDSKFTKNTTPQSGDIVAWEGHTGVVESYDKDTKKVMVLHETKYTKSDGTKVEGAVREEYSTSYYQKKGAGFYQPKVENPDVLSYSTGKDVDMTPVNVNGTGTSTMQPIQPVLQVKELDDKLR